MHRLRHQLQRQRVARVAFNQRARLVRLPRQPARIEDRLPGIRVEPFQGQRSHGLEVGFPALQSLWTLAAGQQHATGVATVRRMVEQLGITLVARAQPAAAVAVEQTLEVVEHQQAALAAHPVEQEGELRIQAGGQLAQRRSGQHLQHRAQHLVQRRGVEQRAPDHVVEVPGQRFDDPGGQRGLADATHAQHGDEPAALLEQPLLELRRFGRSPIQHAGVRRLAPIVSDRHPVCQCRIGSRSDRCGIAGRRGHACRLARFAHRSPRRVIRDRTGPDLPEQRTGLLVRLDLQVIVQHLAAAFVGRQRRRAVAHAGQRGHAVAMRRLAPRIQFQDAAGRAFGCRKHAGCDIGGSQSVKCRQRQALTLLAREHEPLVERGATRDAEARHQWPAVERNRLLQRRGIGRARQAHKRRHVDLGTVVPIPLDRLARAQQQRAGTACVAQRRAQPRDCVAQIGKCGVVALLGPQQAGHVGATMRPVGLDGQVHQQRPDLVAAELRDSGAVADHLKRTEQR